MNLRDGGGGGKVWSGRAHLPVHMPARNVQNRKRENPPTSFHPPPTGPPFFPRSRLHFLLDQERERERESSCFSFYIPTAATCLLSYTVYPRSAFFCPFSSCLFIGVVYAS